jgi:hypothetical protein
MQEEALFFESISIELRMDRYCMILADLVVADAIKVQASAWYLVADEGFESRCMMPIFIRQALPAYSDVFWRLDNSEAVRCGRNANAYDASFGTIIKCYLDNSNKAWQKV